MTAPIDPVPAPTGRDVFFYSPHQDDESLWFGQGLAHHSLVGRRVHIVAGTDGSTSAVLAELNGSVANGWWGGFHYPVREGIPVLTAADFAAARDRELVQAARQLGVSPDRVHLRVDERSANITVEQARAMILGFEALTPGAGHYTMHWLDLDPNHANMGVALRQLALAGLVSDARWIVRREQVGSITGAVPYPLPSEFAVAARHMAACAGRCYGAWAPPEAYAIGLGSVGADDFAWASTASNVYVKTP